MRRGFIFSYELCVGCKACSAACMLENGWSFRSRNIYSSNGECFTPGPVINLSMACNHCNDPVCLVGCPSGAYIKNKDTGAVIIDPDKCLGCRYCIWNCPYDAPKYNYREGIIEKCHFCYHRLEEGIEPACSSSCPTGALAFGDLPDSVRIDNYAWFPEKELNPSLLISGSDDFRGPDIIPEDRFSKDSSPVISNEKKEQEWSLVGFTFLTILSVATNVSDLFSESSLNRLMAVMLVTVAAMFSFFHLGSKLKAWRAIGNLRSSPLSREIALFLLYYAIVIFDQFSELRFSGILAAITGIALVIVIDSVYSFTAGRKGMILTSNHGLFTLMLMVSFLLNMVFAFVFIAIVKILLSVIMMQSENGRGMFAFRFIRMAILIITSLAMITGTDAGALTVMLLFLFGELADRIIFYIDFKPGNIKNTITSKI